MTSEIEQLKSISSEEEFSTGLAIYRKGGVKKLDEQGDALRFIVDGDPRRLVRLGVRHRVSGRCSCDTFITTHKPCRHLVAAMLLARDCGAVEEAQRKYALLAADDLLRQLEQSLPMEAQLQLELTLHLPQNEQGELLPAISLRVGQERLYVVRNIATFLHDLRAQKEIPFGKGFTLQPRWMAFGAQDRKILDLLDEALYVHDLQPAPLQKGEDAKRFSLLPIYMPRLLRLLTTRTFCVALPEGTHAHTKIVDGPVQLYFEVQQSALELRIIAQMPDRLFPLTSGCEFVLCKNEIIRTQRTQQPLLRTLLKQARTGRVVMIFDTSKVQQVMSEILPRLEEAGDVRLSTALSQRIVRKPLSTRIYLDRDGMAVTARTLFLYGDEQIDPFAPEALQNSDKQLLLVRDAAGERAVLDQLALSGFHVQAGRVYLGNNDAIYHFLTGGVQDLQSVAEIYCSEDFKKMAPRRPRFSGSLRMQEGKLQLEMLEEGQPVEELLPILEALRNRKKYFHLKDGTFLDLSDMDDWIELAEAASDAQETAGNAIDMAAYRAAYLTSLLGEHVLPVTADESVQVVSHSLGEAGDPCPTSFEDILRPYQKRGFSWMQALYRLKMGGILADDMGLGKTVQVIALFLWAKEQLGDVPSVVVAPTSLVYNWQAEFARFAPQMRVLVIEGTQGARAEQMRKVESGEVDVLITSYPLIRRDIQRLSKLSFRFAVLDEAQYIKNAMSVGAIAVKQLQAECRLALTGTPMENHPGELWSIFDFILPGYLQSYAQFMHTFGGGEHLQTLKRRIRPFLMRRLKSEVLRELPDKMEMQLLAEMTQEQRRVYDASMLRLRGHVGELLNRGGGRGRMEVLAAITELRQICGHPTLCLEDYNASSGKLDMLMDVLPGALEAGHRVLLFSQFTRMLRIIKRRLEAEGITCMYLDGETPPKERMGLVEEFNAGTGQVFLISLKAGGSGLNLTGADMVIHYDPWWNPAVEDQATDRAHRIGQEKVVQVFRMITRGSIEEQVVRLGENKRQLFDQMITSGEQMPTQLKSDDIRALFEDILEA